LYFSFLYSLPGVSSETLGAEPSPSSGQSARFPFNEDAAAANGFLSNRQAAASKLSSSRAFYSVVRLNAKLFAFGGNDGNGATTAVDVNSQ
jgi:hypothetical protein